jgi:putative transcriptional regulator
MSVSKIKVARVAKDLTQEELAQAVGVTRQTIGLIEAGNYNPTLNLCLRLSKVLGQNLDQLFGEEDHEDDTKSGNLASVRR